MKVVKAVVFSMALVFSLKVTSQDLSQGFLLNYAFDGNADDSSGNGFHGVNYRANYVEDRFGNEFSAIYFNGVDSYVDLPNNFDLKPELPVTFSFWIKYNDNSYEHSTVFNTSFEEDVNSGVYMNIQSSTSKYQISFGDGANFYSANSRRTFTSDFIIDPNVWHHIVIVLNDALDMKIYVDCFESEGSYSGNGGELSYSSLPGTIGRHDRSLVEAADYFKGALDDFRYWNRALTQDEVKMLCEECNQLSVAESSSSAFSVNIFPNPSEGFIRIKSDAEIDNIVIFNSLGEQVLNTAFNPYIDLSDFVGGIYIIKLIGESFVETRKIMLK